MKTIFTVPEEFIKIVVKNTDGAGRDFLKSYKGTEDAITYSDFYKALTDSLNHSFKNSIEDRLIEDFSNSLSSFGSWSLVNFYYLMYETYSNPNVLSKEDFDYVESRLKIKHTDIFDILFQIQALPSNTDGDNDLDELMVKFLLAMSINYFSSKCFLKFGVSTITLNQVAMKSKDFPLGLKEILTDVVLCSLNDTDISSLKITDNISLPALTVLFEMASTIVIYFEQNKKDVGMEFFKTIIQGDVDELSENS